MQIWVFTGMFGSLSSCMVASALDFSQMVSDVPQEPSDTQWKIHGGFYDDELILRPSVLVRLSKQITEGKNKTPSKGEEDAG